MITDKGKSVVSSATDRRSKHASSFAFASFVFFAAYLISLIALVAHKIHKLY